MAADIAQGDPAFPTDGGDRSTRSVLATQVDEYRALSREYAARGDSRLAALALWAADLRAVQALLWDGGIGDLDDPTEPLLAVGGAIDSALAARDVATSQHSVLTVLEGARDALLTAFDASVHDQLRSHFADAGHLDGVPPPAPGAANQAVGHRLDGRGGEQLVGDLLATAEDCRAVAAALSHSGDDEEARRQRVLADLAGFEAYLVLSSAAGGDATLATTELRWDQAARRLTEPVGHSGGDAPELGPEAVRDAIRSVLLPAEDAALRALLDDEPEPGAA